MPGGFCLRFKHLMVNYFVKGDKKMVYKKEYVGDFRELKVYQKALAFQRSIYEIVKKFPDFERYNMVDQLHRAVSSIPANIAEGNGNYYFKQEFDRLNTALGSLAEIRSFLDMALSEGYSTLQEYENLEKDAQEILRLLIGMMRRIEQITG